MTSIKEFIKRGIRYIIKGVPNVNIKTEILTISQNKLLTGRTALITGGTSGIGKAIAEAYLKSNATVIITGRNHERVMKTVSELQQFSDKIYGVCLDIKDVNNFSLKIKEIESICKSRINILVNNAGILGGVFNNTNENEFDEVMNTNLKGPFFFIQEIANYMINNGIKGNILNIASSSSLRPANSAYICSKWGIRALTLGLAKILIKDGIIVNGIAPGPTATPMMKNNKDSNISLPNNPSGRLTMPTEIANLAVFLVSDMGRQIVGDIIYMTGGAGVITYDDVNY